MTTCDIKSIYCTEIDLVDSGYTIKNDMICYVGVDVIGHF